MEINLYKLFILEVSPLELFVRGTVMYFSLLVALRVLVRRHVGSMSLMDLLLMVLIADAAQNGMSAEYKSITEGLILCGTLIGWNYFIDWITYRYTLFQKLIEPAPLPVIKKGKLLKQNMRREFITEEELLSHLRQQEISNFSEVELAYIEPDGSFSLKRKKASKQNHNVKKPQSI